MHTITNLIKRVNHLFVLLISMIGYVPKNATIFRTIAFLFSLIFAFYLGRYQTGNYYLAIFYFLLSEVCYLSFIIIVLSENGLRHWFTRIWGNINEGYTAYETVLGFLFFHNAASIGYIASSSPGSLFPFIQNDLLFIIVVILFITGFTIKIWAAKVVGIEIYYWKDMFLGRKISDFVVSGPYKYISNPMYGIGQLQAYAIALWYGSVIGLTAALVNQLLIFSFYFFIERKFIKRIYQGS